MLFLKGKLCKGTGCLLRLKPSGPFAPCRTGIVSEKPGFRSATHSPPTFFTGNVRVFEVKNQGFPD
jgi:hypothetical protein